jgi:hypothetical protein
MPACVTPSVLSTKASHLTRNSSNPVEDGIVVQWGDANLVRFEVWRCDGTCVSSIGQMCVTVHGRGGGVVCEAINNVPFFFLSNRFGNSSLSNTPAHTHARTHTYTNTHTHTHMLLALLSVLVPTTTASITSTPVVVRTKDGAVSGTCTNDVCAFKNIPFSIPPTPEHGGRFRAPAPLTKGWEGIKDGKACSALFVGSRLMGDEHALIAHCVRTSRPLIRSLTFPFRDTNTPPQVRLTVKLASRHRTTR